MRVGVPAVGTGAPSRVPHTVRQKGVTVRHAQRVDMKKAAVADAARGLLRLLIPGRQSRIPFGMCGLYHSGAWRRKGNHAAVLFGIHLFHAHHSNHGRF